MEYGDRGQAGQQTSLLLRRAATEVLLRNWTGRWTVPSRTLYPHQWSWDSAFIAVGLRHLSPRRAEQELESLLGAQWPDGRIPHIVFDPQVPADAYFPGPDFWRAGRPGGPTTPVTSGLIQPPVHALAVWETARADPDPTRRRAFLAATYPRLVGWHRYLRERRDLAGHGLVSIVHPWESGMDNSPAWDGPLSRVAPAPMDQVRRRDLGHAAAAERPTDLDYGRYIRLAANYRDGGCADTAGGIGFAVEDPLVNALLVVSEDALSRIAAELGANPEPHCAARDRLRAALLEHLYHPAEGIFFGHDVLAGRPIRRHTVAGLVPLLVPGLAIADELLRTATGPRFGLGSAWLVPSYDLTAHDFDPARYWRGPGWYNTSWLLWRGLRELGRTDLSVPLGQSMVDCVRRHGFREYVDPHTGTGHGARDFSWTAAVILDLLTQPGRPGPA